MSKRFGRNQKRAMRAQIAQLQRVAIQAREHASLERGARFHPFGEAPGHLPGLPVFGAPEFTNRYDLLISEERLSRGHTRKQFQVSAYLRVSEFAELSAALSADGMDTQCRFRGHAVYVVRADFGDYRDEARERLVTLHLEVVSVYQDRNTPRVVLSAAQLKDL